MDYFQFVKLLVFAQHYSNRQNSLHCLSDYNQRYKIAISYLLVDVTWRI